MQVFELMRGLDKDCDSTIDLQEFAARFETVFTRLNAKQDVRATKQTHRLWCIKWVFCAMYCPVCGGYCCDILS